MKIGAIIQARMTSTRLPGKILKEVFSGLTMLESCIARVHNVHEIDVVIVATTTNHTDDPVIALCRKIVGKYPKLRWFRGSEMDVLSRYYFAAKEHGLTDVIRVTSDCPVIQPKIIRDMILKYKELGPERCDYISNVKERTYPRGFDTEIFRFKALEEAYFDPMTSDTEKEHVTLYINTQSDRFKIVDHEQDRDLSGYRLTVDTQDDIGLIRLIFTKLYANDQMFDQDAIIRLLESRPDWVQINSHIEQKSHLVRGVKRM